MITVLGGVKKQNQDRLRTGRDIIDAKFEWYEDHDSVVNCVGAFAGNLQ